jgi:hypothetical protein
LEGSDCEDFGILVFDEIGQCDNGQQKIIANILLAREIHGRKLKAGWTIVCTSNRATDRAGAGRVLGHLQNRVTALNLEISLDDWTQWALENNVQPEVISFLRFRPDLLNNYSASQDVNATPRAWTQGVSAQLGVIDTAAEFEVFTGEVGEGPAAEFLAFLKIFRKLPSPDAILADPKKSPVPDDPATLYALCGALAHRSTPVNFGRVLTYVRRMPPEFSVLFIKDATGRNAELCHTKEFIDWASKEGADLLT